MRWYTILKCVGSMPSDIVWVQCHIRCVGPRCVRSVYNASRLFLASDSFYESGWHFTLQMHLHTVVAGPFWQLYRSVQAIPGLWPEGIIIGYHCFINAAIFRDVGLFEGSIQILENRTSLTVLIHRQTDSYHQRNGDLSLSRQSYYIL